MNRIPRVAFLTDCFHEVNGVALTSRQLEAYARRNGYPFFSLHAGSENLVSQEGSVTTCELRRGPASMGLDSGMSFDFAFLRHRPRVREALKQFQPDLFHITGPGDCGILGAVLSHEFGKPLVCSWHTNLHEFGRTRLEHATDFLPVRWRSALGAAAEQYALDATLRFYRLGRVLMAPNAELVRMLETRAHRPTHLMQRGIDTVLFDPAKRQRSGDDVVIGFVGRLSAEKRVRFLAEIECGLRDAGVRNYRFLVVGQGKEEAWLRANLQQAALPGVLRGEDLARAYASMDIFAFPSTTDTFGNVIQEALASGVPAVVTTGGGPKYLVEHGVTGVVAPDDAAFIGSIVALATDRERRARMSQAARRWALGVSWDAVMAKVYAAYGDCWKTARARLEVSPALSS